MPMYLMLSTLGPEGMATLRENPQRLKEVNGEVEAMGVRVVSQWALLGPYDFATILEAPDEKVVARVALTLGARGTLKTKTLTAIPIDEFIEAVGGSRRVVTSDGRSSGNLERHSRRRYWNGVRGSVPPHPALVALGPDVVVGEDVG